MSNVEQVTVHVEFRQQDKVYSLKKVYRGNNLPTVGQLLPVKTPDAYSLTSYLYEKTVDGRHLKARTITLPSELNIYQFRRFLLENGWKEDKK